MTQDPTAALEGSQLTFGGYKGANIALMIELMASVGTFQLCFELNYDTSLSYSSNYIQLDFGNR